MKKTNVIESKAETYYIKGKNIPKGCKYCLKGSKVVIFLNGICQNPEQCSWYCPISEERRGKNLTFADEIEINTKEEILNEIELIDAKGASITGGEPLSELNLEKTIDYIKFLKSKKGKKFHIHLYTNGINFDETIADRLSSAGLDEIRFHPTRNDWDNIRKALNTKMCVGAEVPVIPGDDNIKYIEDFVIFLDQIGVDFINLNEFEFCFSNSESLKIRGFNLKKDSIAAVMNSKETAIELLRKLGPQVSLKMHFCSIRAKDYYQMKNRYYRRANNIRLPYEVITEEGLLLYSQIEGSAKKLEEFHAILLSSLKIPEKYIFFNNKEIKVPFYFSIEDNFISLLEEYDLKGYVIEITPFRESKYQQITEKTPLKLFKEEYGFNEN
ncbi:MAG: radical SAM protein [Candidatus Thorarchaeota archaeon]